MARVTKVQWPLDGIAPTRTEMNTVAASAAQAEDNAISTIFDAPAYVSGTPARGVIPTLGTLVSIDTVGTRLNGVRVWAHVAFAGPFSTDPNNITTASSLGTTRDFANGSGNASAHRYDLVYEVIFPSIADTVVQRKIKDISSKVVSVANSSVTSHSAVTYGIVTGTESTGTPTLPTAPADPVGGYVIPLAYVRLPGNYVAGTTGVFPYDIMEIADVLPLPGTPRPANQLTKFNSLITTIGLAKISDPGRYAFLPANMSGGAVSRFLAYRVASAGFSTGAFADGTVLDDSIDWSGRAFKWTAQIASGSNYAWIASGPPSADTTAPSTVSTVRGVGQSFRAEPNLGSLIVPARIDHSNSYLGSAEWTELVVDSSNRLICKHSGVFAATAVIFIWLDATGQFLDTI